MILVGGGMVMKDGDECKSWAIDADRDVQVVVNATGTFLRFTNGPGVSQKIALTREATAVLFCALHYEITGRYFDPGTLTEDNPHAD